MGFTQGQSPWQFPTIKWGATLILEKGHFIECGDFCHIMFWNLE